MGADTARAGDDVGLHSKRQSDKGGHDLTLFAQLQVPTSLEANRRIKSKVQPFDSASRSGGCKSLQLAQPQVNRRNSNANEFSHLVRRQRILDAGSAVKIK